MTKQRNYGLYLALLAIVTLSACGIKPNELKPPEGSKKTDFPKTYPSSAHE